MDAIALPSAEATICLTVLRSPTGDALREARGEIERAIQVNHGTILAAEADEVRAVFGRPRPVHDHALRAIRAACDQVEFLHSACAAGGEPLGFAVALAPAGDAAGAERLAALAPDGAALIAADTLRVALVQLPVNWEAIETRIDAPANGVQILIGPSVGTTPSLAAFRFTSTARLPEAPEIVRVERPARGGDLAAQELYASPQPRQLGRYQLIALIGRGATAEVWRAQTEEGEVVAIKRLRDSATASEQHRRRFAREAAILSRLDHPHLCRVREMQADEDDRYLVMDFIEGVTLAELMGALTAGGSSLEARLDLGLDLAALVSCVERARGDAPSQVDEPPTTARTRPPQVAGTLPVPQALAVMNKIAVAVAHAHQHGVLHRDLKPANILIRPDGEPVVTDFGLAKLTAPPHSSISLAGQILGTLEYMAPEQARSSREVDARADVYSLGAILYELLTGRRAFLASGHLLHDAERLQTHRPVAPREFQPQLDPALELIVLQALRLRPAERYASVEEFLADLVRYSRGEPVEARTPSLRTRAAGAARAIRLRFSRPKPKR